MSILFYKLNDFLHKQGLKTNKMFDLNNFKLKLESLFLQIFNYLSRKSFF